MRFDIDNCGFTFDKTIQVSKGEKTFPFVTLMKVDDVCFIVNHSKQKLPFKRNYYLIVDIILKEGILGNTHLQTIIILSAKVSPVYNVTLVQEL